VLTKQGEFMDANREIDHVELEIEELKRRVKKLEVALSWGLYEVEQKFSKEMATIYEIN
jgi:hypothetical protein